MIRELAAKKRLTVSFDFDAGVSQIMADERRLKQMLVNLLSNAVKFTPAGGEVGLEIRGDALNHILSFTVWDTGIGIRSEDLPHLFKPFVQLDGGLARSAEGTGLGLALVSEMASLHGGGVGVESEPGKGSRFTVSIPWVKPPVESPAPAGRVGAAGAGATGAEGAAPASAQGGRPAAAGALVLMVDDTEASLMVVRDYLTTQGYRVITARDGLEGVAMAKLSHPDVVLMDVMMPGLDGLEATRRMRKDPSLKKTPVIALTALAMPGDRERCLEAGMNDYLSKPVKPDELVGVIEGRLRRNA